MLHLGTGLSPFPFPLFRFIHKEWNKLVSLLSHICSPGKLWKRLGMGRLKGPGQLHDKPYHIITMYHTSPSYSFLLFLLRELNSNSWRKWNLEIILKTEDELLTPFLLFLPIFSTSATPLPVSFSTSVQSQAPTWVLEYTDPEISGTPVLLEVTDTPEGGGNRQEG